MLCSNFSWKEGEREKEKRASFLCNFCSTNITNAGRKEDVDVNAYTLFYIHTKVQVFQMVSHFYYHYYYYYYCLHSYTTSKFYWCFFACILGDSCVWKNHKDGHDNEPSCQAKYITPLIIAHFFAKEERGKAHQKEVEKNGIYTRKTITTTIITSHSTHMCTSFWLGKKRKSPENRKKWCARTKYG